MKIEIHTWDRIIAFMGYIPFLAFIPYIAPESLFTKFHRKISLILLCIDIVILVIALYEPYKKICFFVLAFCLLLALIGMIVSVSGIYSYKRKKH